jgi:hypothetical protein
LKTTLEPNLLLAIATSTALALQVLTASAYGRSLGPWHYPLLAIACAGGFVLLNALWMRRRGKTVRPMVAPGNPTAAMLTGILPLLIIFGAALPVFIPGVDYGLLVIVGAVFTGLTIESAIRARKAY